MGRGPGTFPEFACRHVRLLVDSSCVRDFTKMFLNVRGFGKDFICVRYVGEMFMDLLRFVNTRPSLPPHFYPQMLTLRATRTHDFSMF